MAQKKKMYIENVKGDLYCVQSMYCYMAINPLLMFCGTHLPSQNILYISMESEVFFFIRFDCHFRFYCEGDKLINIKQYT